MKEQTLGQDFYVDIILRYIAVWGWQILSVIFLCSSIILVSLLDKTVALVFFLSFFVVFVALQIRAFSKKRRILSIGENE